MGCPFCATGQAGLRPQLYTDEIAAQIVAAQRLLQRPGGVADGVTDHVTNVVFIGMGEPLANTAVTLATLRWLTARDGFNLSAGAITVSISGLIPGIRRLQREQLPITLAISLHAPDDELRDRLVPSNRRFPLAALLAPCDEYVATGIEAACGQLYAEYRANSGATLPLVSQVAPAVGTRRVSQVAPAVGTRRVSEVAPAVGTRWVSQVARAVGTRGVPRVAPMVGTHHA
jgi:hypothetical protein